MSLGTRVFTDADQARFAALSGDRNPMHIDPVAARRIGAGALVVHGVHTLLWCLDRIAPALPQDVRVASLRVNFDRFVTVGEAVAAVLVAAEAGSVRAEARAVGVTVLTAVVGLGARQVAAPAAKPAERVDASQPLDPPDDALAHMAGRVAFATPVEEIAAAFPRAARLLGARRVAALAAFTRLVGMVCPGLHSVFNRITLEASDDDGADDIGFRVASVSLHHRRLVLTVWGGGWSGTLTTMLRHRPTAQPLMTDLAALVGAGEFAGRVALVVGGSRGIGEVAAKLIAAGGGAPVISYAAGEADAQRVAGAIRAWGGTCDLFRLDVTQPIEAQLAVLATTPTQLLYFATPMIAARRAQLFEPDRLAVFLRFYVTGFYECSAALIARGAAPLTALYPSSVFVTERPGGMTEYAMAKAAGEQLCRDMTSGIAGFRAVVARLPRLATDQNPGFAGPSVAEVLLPLLRDIVLP